MSEAARQLNMRIVTRDAMAVEAMVKRMDAPLESREDLINAAVAPLVEALEDCIGMLQLFTGSRYDEEGAVAAQISDAEQALAAWRNEDE